MTVSGEAEWPEVADAVIEAVEFVDLSLLGRVRPLLSERVCRRPAGSRRQKKRGQQQTDSNAPEQFHRLTSFAL